MAAGPSRPLFHPGGFLPFRIFRKDGQDEGGRQRQSHSASFQDHASDGLRRRSADPRRNLAPARTNAIHGPVPAAPGRRRRTRPASGPRCLPAQDRTGGREAADPGRTPTTSPVLSNRTDIGGEERGGDEAGRTVGSFSVPGGRSKARETGRIGSGERLGIPRGGVHGFTNSLSDPSVRQDGRRRCRRWRPLSRAFHLPGTGAVSRGPRAAASDMVGWPNRMYAESANRFRVHWEAASASARPVSGR